MKSSHLFCGEPTNSHIYPFSQSYHSPFFQYDQTTEEHFYPPLHRSTQLSNICNWYSIQSPKTQQTSDVVHSHSPILDLSFLFVFFCFPFCYSFPLSTSIAQDGVGCCTLCASIPFLFFRLMCAHHVVVGFWYLNIFIYLLNITPSHTA